MVMMSVEYYSLEMALRMIDECVIIINGVLTPNHHHKNLEPRFNLFYLEIWERFEGAT